MYYVCSRFSQNWSVIFEIILKCYRHWNQLIKSLQKQLKQKGQPTWSPSLTVNWYRYDGVRYLKLLRFFVSTPPGLSLAVVPRVDVITAWLASHAPSVKLIMVIIRMYISGYFSVS